MAEMVAKKRSRASYECEDDESEDEGSVGSLVEFIVKDDQVQGDAEDDESGDEYEARALAEIRAQAARDEITKGGTTVEESTGLRRSRRTVKAPERYIDPDYQKLMIEEGELEELEQWDEEEPSDDEDGGVNEADEDVNENDVADDDYESSLSTDSESA